MIDLKDVDNLKNEDKLKNEDNMEKVDNFKIEYNLYDLILFYFAKLSSSRQLQLQLN